MQEAAGKCDLKGLKQMVDGEENGGLGMDINQADQDVGYTALTEAIKSMHIVGKRKKTLKMYDFILSQGADVNALLKTDESPLHIACYIGRPEIAKLLLEKGAKPDEPDKAGWAPIHWACLNGHDKCVDILLEHDIDLTRKVGNLLPFDLCRLRLERGEHGDGMFEYEPDPWTGVEKDRSVFHKICSKIETLEQEQREREKEAKREARRIRWPGDPLYDRKMRKKVYCTRCRQGYRSVSKQRGICMECRENDAETARKDEFERRAEIREFERKMMREKKKRKKWERLMIRSSELYPEVTAEEEAYLLWDSTLRVLLKEAEEYDLETEARYYKAILHLDPESYNDRLEGRFESIVNKEPIPNY